MIEWTQIDTGFLDMDGTLLDLYFDNHFWREHMPRRYAEYHGLDEAVARSHLDAHYDRHAGTLNWYCVDFWSSELALDIVALKEEVVHLIAVRPDVPARNRPRSVFRRADFVASDWPAEGASGFLAGPAGGRAVRQNPHPVRRRQPAGAAKRACLRHRPPAGDLQSRFAPAAQGLRCIHRDRQLRAGDAGRVMALVLLHFARPPVAPTSYNCRAPIASEPT
jgi:hypothetical protein